MTQIIQCELRLEDKEGPKRQVILMVGNERVVDNKWEYLPEETRRLIYRIVGAFVSDIQSIEEDLKNSIKEKET